MHAVLIASILAAAAESTAEEPDVRCGAYCLYTALKTIDAQSVSFREVESRLGPPDAAGYSLGELERVAQSFGVETLGVETTFDALQRRERPFACIMHLTEGHFVLLGDVTAGMTYVVDPPRALELPADTLQTRWSGAALLIAQKPLAPEKSLRPVGSWWKTAATIVLAAAVALIWWSRRRTGHAVT